MVVLEVDEQKILLAEARKYAEEHDPRWFVRPFLGLHTGARSGEISGLQWGDINWEQRTLTINKAVHYVLLNLMLLIYLLLTQKKVKGF